MGTFQRSYQIFRESWGVLVKDKELLLFPILSGLFSIIAFIGMVGGGIASGLFLAIAGRGPEQFPRWVGGAYLFVWYFVTWLIATSFNVAVLACARIRFDGGDPTTADGFAAIQKHFGAIALWALISATVGLVLDMIKERFEVVGAILKGILGAVWSIATFFVVPVMIFEGPGLGDSVKRSVELVKKSWGEALGVTAGVGLFTFLLAIPGFVLPIVLGFTLGGTAALIGAGVAVVYWIALAVVSSALSGIFRAALYLYATKGEVPSGYTGALVQTAFRTR